jgi:hypothetical protein
MLYKYSETSPTRIAKHFWLFSKSTEGFTHGLGEFQEGRKERREFQK